jgi:FkbM family methyltransferase
MKTTGFQKAQKRRLGLDVIKKLFRLGNFAYGIDRIREVVYYRYLTNKYYALNGIIENTELLENGLIRVELKNGMKLYDQKVRLRNEYSEDVSYRWAIKRRIPKIRHFNDYRQIYKRIYDEFVVNQHLKVFPLGRGDIVVDAGANIGSFTINAASIVGPEGKVIAIEPEKANCDILRRTIDANDLSNVTIVPKGLWSKKGTRALFLDDLPGLHSVFSNRPGDTSQKSCVERRKKECSEVVIEVDNLDNILNELGVGKVDFIKMDIEGAEIEALKGAKITLDNSKAKLVVEAGHVVNGEQTCKKIVPWLGERNFRVLDFCKGELNEVGLPEGTVFAVKDKRLS